MKRFPILLAAMTAVPGIATELHVFSAGQAAKAQEVNDNFQRLDTAIQNRATKADSATLAKATLDSATSLRKAIDASQAQAQPYLPINDPVYTGTISGPRATMSEFGVLRNYDGDNSRGAIYPTGVTVGANNWAMLVKNDGTDVRINGESASSLCVGGASKLSTASDHVNLNVGVALRMSATTVIDASRNASFASVAVHSPANKLRQIALSSDVASRWILRSEGTEPNDYIELRAYNDAGIYQDAPWAVARSAGSPFVIKRPLRLMVGYGVGILHSSSNGTLTSSAIVNDDLGSLGDTGKIVKFGAKGLAVATSDDLAAMGVVLASGGTITGDLRISGKLTTPPGATPADYVFEPDYKLAPLSEVEAFTKEHKHLPEVPSAREMTENGVDMAAMNMVLLKKVEELTLHAIALQKDVEAQKAALADQQKVMADMKAALETMQGN